MRGAVGRAAAMPLVGAALALLLAGVGCVALAAVETPATPRFHLLRERRLAAFEHRLAVERQTGADDAWTRVGEAWVALATCQPIAASAIDRSRAPLAAFLYSTLELEEARRARLMASKAGRRKLAQTIFSSFERPDFFDRAAPEMGGHEITWPPDVEVWPDEMPAPVTLVTACPSTEAGGELELTQMVELDVLEQTLALAEALPEKQRDVRVSALVWRLHFHGAARAVSNQRDDESDLQEAAKAHLTALSRWESPRISDGERALALLLFAVVGDDRADISDQLARAEELGLEGDNAWAARAMRLQRLLEEERFAEATRLTDLPPAASPYLPPVAFFLGHAYVMTGATPELFALCKQVFNDRPWRSHRLLAALYSRVVRAIADHPFEPRTVELLEELGPRNQTHARVEELARAYLDRGHPDGAEAAGTWLLEHHRDARLHVRYHAIRALAAFVRDDRRGFVREVRKVADRPSELLEAIPRWRQAGFFARADHELARLVREMLPIMAEWGETKSATSRRQQWLATVVTEIQRFLRNADVTAIREQLLELYRVASAQLDAHPRGYARRVGEREPTPVVLGRVDVAWPALSWKTDVPLEIPEPFVLSLIPTAEAPVAPNLAWEGPDA